jgi:hypothetical protein
MIKLDPQFKKDLIALINSYSIRRLVNISDSQLAEMICKVIEILSVENRGLK